MTYNKKDIHKIVEEHRNYFNSSITLDVNFRLQQLKNLKQALIANEDLIAEALKQDLGRNYQESFTCDIGPCIVEINENIKGLKKWAKPERHFSGLMCFPSIFTKVYKMPYGVVLIISPFNFPILLSIGVLAAAIAAGNTVVIKTSSKSQHCSAVLKKIIAQTFNENYITVVDGGHDIADMCLEERFDKIFYTGSPQVGKHVLAKAAENLIPVALELGGENGNWAIIRKDCDIKDTAKKIAFFKLLNAGQICININQIAVDKQIAQEFIKELKNQFNQQIGDNPLNNEEYPHLINKAAYDKAEKTIQEYQTRVIYGGKGNPDNLKIEPTIIYPVNINEDIVSQELFSPILPIVQYQDKDIDVLLDIISSRQHPLAFYLFTKNQKWADKTMAKMQYGGGCINEVCMHMMVKGVPFNGVGHSGMGAYHGIWGFREFSHPQTVLKGYNRFNLPLRYHPYSTKKTKLCKIFEK